MKSTPLTDIHIKLGAKMAEFAGYNMPISYTGINAEHHAVRENVGVFDVSHMGEFVLKGSNALALVQQVTTNDASKLAVGDVQYSCMTNDTGGIIDDLLVYHLQENSYMLVVNASNIQKDWNWILKHNTFDVDMKNISDQAGLLAVQGPNALKVVQKLTEVDLSQVPYYKFARGIFGGVKNVLMSNTGYTGAGGFEIYFENIAAEDLWRQIFNAGKEFNIQPVGLGARDTLRLEMGFCLYGNDIDDTTSPIEAGLGWITKFTKDFTARKILEEQKVKGVTRKLVGFEMIDKGIARHGHEIFDQAGNKIGIVTSGTQSPSLQKAIGMGYVSIENSKEGTFIFINIRDKNLKAQVVKMPFYKK
ncbi:MAG TPA: glycine cleavage system aminomethyltransferase GcvT [Chitinophagales bacterium]|nr:glycine cleavage system aminomethyltransferase GcvT [Chitinophagales bacterium]